MHKQHLFVQIRLPRPLTRIAHGKHTCIVTMGVREREREREKGEERGGREGEVNKCVRNGFTLLTSKILCVCVCVCVCVREREREQ